MATAYQIGGSPFEKALRQFGEKAGNYMDAIVHRVVIDLSASIVYDSPWGQPEFWKSGHAPAGYTPGLFRGNWQYTTDAPAEGKLTIHDADGRSTVGRIAAAVKPTGAGERVHYIVNNADHGPPLEYDGHSWQAPQPGGVVKKNVLRFEAIVANAVAQVVK